jgi:hypothetical protein
VKLKIYITALVVVVFLALGFFYVRSTPQYSLYMLKRAIEERNPNEALKYINIDSIVESIARSLLNKNEKDPGQDTNKRTALKGVLIGALPEIKESIRSSLHKAILSRGKSIAKSNPDNATGITDQRAHGFSIGEIAIGNFDVRRIEKISLWDLTVKNNGGTAIVSVKNNPGIKAKMARIDTGHWQITEVLLLP